MTAKKLLPAYAIALMLIVSASRAEGPITRFTVSGEKMKKIATEAIGLVSIREIDSSLCFFPDYSNLGQPSKGVTIVADSLAPFSIFCYSSDTVTHGVGDYPVVAMRGRAVEVIYNSNIGSRGWIQLEDLPMIESVYLFDALEFTPDRALELLPTSTGESLPVYTGYNGLRVPDHRYSTTPGVGFMVLRVVNGYAELATGYGDESGFSWGRGAGEIIEFSGKLRYIGWVPLRTPEGVLRFWLNMVDRC